jgi:hypothetical protein
MVARIPAQEFDHDDESVPMRFAVQEVVLHNSQLAELRHLLTEDFAESHVHRQRRGFAPTQAAQANANIIRPYIDELDVGAVRLEEGTDTIEHGFNAGAFDHGVPQATVVGLRMGTAPIAPSIEGVRRGC